MDSEKRRRESVVGRRNFEPLDDSPTAQAKGRSTATMAFGILLFILGGINAGNGSAVGFLLALLGIGLIVAGVVIRPRR